MGQPATSLLAAPSNEKGKRIFVAGTRMNDGKTTVCLGLFAALQQRFAKVGFIKPIGQRFVEVAGHLIDEDSILLERTYRVEAPIESMSPIAIDSAFTRRYLDDPAATLGTLTDKLCRAFDRASWEKNFTLIEGSGHAGVGSVFDLSNARVARILNAKAIIVGSGGIGQPVDEISLNKALFDKEGVEVIGAIINKVEPEKLDEIRHYASKGLKRLGVPLLGLLPRSDVLLSPSLRQIAERIRGDWLNGEAIADQTSVKRVIIGAMTASGILDALDPGTLLITPGDREDLIMAALSYEATRQADPIAGIVLTRGILPHHRLRRMMSQSRIPIILSQTDSYAVASRIHGMTVKTRPEDAVKIPLIKRLVQEQIDLDLLAGAFES